MNTKLLAPMMLLAALALPMTAQAQGTVRGAQEGARQGEHAAGPIGAIVGGILGVQDRPRFREYAVQHRQPAYRYTDEVRVGLILPETGPTYYDVPGEYHVQGYRYAYVNDHVVLVDPRTRQIVDIIE